MFSFFKKKPAASPAEKGLIGPIVPRIKNTEFLNAIAKIPGMTAEQIPLALSLAGDLLLTFSMDTADAFISLNRVECARRNLKPNDLLPIADQFAKNLVKSIQIKSQGPVHQIVTGNDMEACTILCVDFWKDLITKFNDNLIVIVPHRNLVYFTPKSSKEGQLFLKTILLDTDFRETHALSNKLFLRDNKGLGVFSEQ